jgi:hypothetical protein
MKAAPLLMERGKSVVLRIAWQCARQSKRSSQPGKMAQP